MTKHDFSPSNNKNNRIVLYIDYIRDNMKLTIMDEIIVGTASEGDKIKTDIDSAHKHERYQYDEHTEQGYVMHKFHYHGQTEPKAIYSKINHYWE